MSTSAINIEDVPGIDALQSRIKIIDTNVTLARVGYDFDKMIYTIVLTGRGREGNIEFSREVLEDLRDNRIFGASRYTQELYAKVTEPLREIIESNGLIAFNENTLKYKLLQFIYLQSKSSITINKYNSIGSGIQGDFERWLRTHLANDEKETLIWVWGELMRLRLITPTGTDVFAPDDWVRITDKGTAAVEGKTYLEYDDQDIFIPKGEVYTAFRAISKIISQAVASVFIIDPYVDENLLDMLASINSAIKIRVLTEHPKGNFKPAYKKLQQQRGNLDAKCSQTFHDRFILVDDVACYQIGGSINHAGAKATTISRKSDQMRDEIIRAADSDWTSATVI